MTRFLLVALLAVAAGCGVSTERRTVEGVDCVVATGEDFGGVAISCDWGNR